MSTRHHDPIRISTLQPTKAVSPWVGRGLWLALTLFLCATNILTLLDDGFRRNAYEAVTSIARPALDGIGMASSARILVENSPAALEKKAIERATAELAARSELLWFCRVSELESSFCWSEKRKAYAGRTCRASA